MPTYYLYKLSSGHTIITPNDGLISNSDFEYYFNKICELLKNINPSACDEIKPNINNNETYGSMVNNIYDVISNSDALNNLESYQLAFIYVVSYYIQKENRERLNPFLCHVMGNALLKWLPIEELIIHYLSLSTECGNSVEDAYSLALIYTPNVTHENYPYIEDIDKAYKYIQTANKNIFNNPSYVDRTKRLLKRIMEYKYSKLMTNMMQMPIYCCNVLGIEPYLNFHLTKDEKDFLLNNTIITDDNSETFRSIFLKLRNPAITNRMLKYCNQMIYMGADEEGKDTYLNFEEAGNIFIHGWPGAGKTWFMKSIYTKMRCKEIYKKPTYLFWSFKPFEFESWCGRNLIKDPHVFIQKIKELIKDDLAQKVIFIDELAELLDSITDEEKEWLKTVMKDSKYNNITFICCSQNMYHLIKEFEDVATTRICMFCGNNKDESMSMIGVDSASLIGAYGELYMLQNKSRKLILV